MTLERMEILRSEVDLLAKSVGFQSAVRPPETEGLTLPDGSWLWAGPYGRILLLPIEGNEVSDLEQVSKSGVAWLNTVLDEAEKFHGDLLDGYLLLAFGEPAEDDLAAAARKLELDPHVCRKHVIWPDPEGSWRNRLARVTPLGLPRPPAPAGPAAAVELPPAAQRLLDLYAEERTLARAAETFQAEIAEEAKNAD